MGFFFFWSFISHTWGQNCQALEEGATRLWAICVLNTSIIMLVFIALQGYRYTLAFVRVAYVLNVVCAFIGLTYTVTRITYESHIVM